MRPKRTKSNLINSSKVATTTSKEEESRKSAKINRKPKVQRTLRNSKTDKSFFKKDSIDKALKAIVDLNEEDYLEKTVTKKTVKTENEKINNKSKSIENGNIKRTNLENVNKRKNGPNLHPECSNCHRVFKSLAGFRRHEVSCNSSKDNDKTNSISKKPNGETSSSNIVANKQTTSSHKPDSLASDLKKYITNVVESIKSEEISPSESDPIPINSHSEFMGEDSLAPEIRNIDNASQATSLHQCTNCNKQFKTFAGLRRHEVTCKKKLNSTNGDGFMSLDNTDRAVEEAEDDVEVPLSSKSVEDYSDPLSENGEISGALLNTIEQSKCDCCGEDLETAHMVGEFECKDCLKLFQLKSSLERHIRVAHDGESLECPQCGAKCPDKGNLARHMYTHTGLKPYSCSVCKQEFSRKYHLVRHNMQTGCDGKAKPIFPCQVCGREFNRKDNLREHLRAHAGQTKRKKKFTCDCCGVEYDATDLLKIHKKIHAGEKHHACDFCPKMFSSSGALKKHRRTHTGERPFECDTCRKRFAAKETLNRHVRIHTGYKPHSCQYCGKSFAQSTQLKSHLYYHTGQSVLQASETFVCDLCGKKFNRRARLNEHVKFIHLGAKPFECVQCNKTFIRKEDLNRHLIIHSGVKAHQCPICSKAFAMKSTLKVHLLTHTKEPPRSCDECGRAFIRQDCLLRHMRNKHREMLEEIKTEAEKKKLQQQLLQVAAEASLVEGMDERAELDENGLVEAVRELLTLLVDETTLKGLGWPSAGVETLLEAVIKRCGHEPAPSSTPRHDRLRHNIKLLFTVVINDSAVKALLNNQTVDEVILHVLRLAKS